MSLELTSKPTGSVALAEPIIDLDPGDEDERTALVEVEATLRLTFLGISEDGKPRFDVEMVVDNSVLQADEIDESSARAALDSWWERGGGREHVVQAAR